MSVRDDQWDPSEIPEHKRKHMYLDEEGFLTVNFRPLSWLTAREARERVAQALRIDAETAASVLHTRLVSGHVIASAAGAYGPVTKRERIKITGGRDMIPNNHWQWIKPTDAVWLVGDLQLRVIGADVSSLRSITYTDVKFLETNVDALIAAAGMPLVGPELDSAPTAAPTRGRPPGTGFDRADAPLIEEINAAVASGAAPSHHQAAQAIVRSGRALGQSPEAAVDRLVRKAKARRAGNN